MHDMYLWMFTNAHDSCNVSSEARNCSVYNTARGLVKNPKA